MLIRSLKRPFHITLRSLTTPGDHAMTRPSFHTLMPHRRHALTIAINRLMDTPSRLGLNTSLYDDFTYIHIQLKNSVHHSAISLPWHRLFIHVFENALRTEGHYDGYLPYWDWTLDANDPLSSPIWDNRTGFGGNGTGPDNCVQEGILGKYIAKYNEWEYDEHCVKRKFEDSVEDGMMHGKQWGKEVVKDIVEGSKTYGEFRERLESGPHKHLHLGIGGEMFGIGSTNDPLFFVHHTQVDRLWWLWQQQNPSERNHEYFGPRIEESDISTEEASIEDQVLMLGMGQDRSVRDLLTTNTDILCYKYAMDI
ncbi:related to monophenol monooxygenase (tyrosinase) [Phialocephala subalpina]|uniref:Related to monophenol monooxygenase (Tyrosinase) n=1 Tax=Phialocephala subalpina TaxID=576137 RepID=A0A1L7XVJ9_9HELO|nr:related to monophenol monooxygenase (tyrosinase) [Phialocephala subalpina]